MYPLSRCRFLPPKLRTERAHGRTFAEVSIYYDYYYYYHCYRCLQNKRPLQNTRCDSQPLFPEDQCRRCENLEWIGVQNKHPISSNRLGAVFSTLNFWGTGAKLTL